MTHILSFPSRLCLAPPHRVPAQCYKRLVNGFSSISLTASSRYTLKGLRNHIIRNPLSHITHSGPDKVTKLQRWAREQLTNFKILVSSGGDTPRPLCLEKLNLMATSQENTNTFCPQCHAWPGLHLSSCQWGHWDLVEVWEIRKEDIQKENQTWVPEETHFCLIIMSISTRDRQPGSRTWACRKCCCLPTEKLGQEGRWKNREAFEDSPSENYCMEAPSELEFHDNYVLLNDKTA